MAKTFTVKDAVAHLKKHRPSQSDKAVAERATAIFRKWGGAERVSRPLVCMLRNGQTGGKGGMKNRAVWQALVEIGALPQLPDEQQQREANPQLVSMRRQLLRLRAKLRNRDQEVVEIPMLTKPVLQYFGFKRNPVFEEIRSSEDLWWGKQHEAAKNALIDAAMEGGFVALVGKRGGGKTMVYSEVRDTLKRRDDVVLAETTAAIVGLLTEVHLMTAIIQGLNHRTHGRDQVYSQAHDSQSRALQMRYLLLQAKRANRKVVLVIEEAHELRAATYLALKRFLDERDGVGQRLLSVILIGQNAEPTSNRHTRDLSEVALRLQTFRLQPMHDDIADYLRFKIQRAGAKVSDVIQPAALKALAKRCAYPLEANSKFAQLLIDAWAEREKPIERRRVEDNLPEDEELVLDQVATS
jgi:type II secretory pathway predicted ATPase ExeA